MDESLNAAERLRYARHIILPELGEEGQLRLKRGSVVIVGAGGLGSPAALYLAAAGVGRIGLVDFDTVDATNLQRQVLFGTRDIGTPKLEAARRRLTDLNDEIEIVTHEGALTSANAFDILRQYEVVLDGTDNFPTRYLVNDACVLLGKPNVHGSIFRFEGQLSVFDSTRGPCYRCMYPDPPPEHLVPSCAEAGVLGVLPGMVGTMQAAEALKLLAGIGEPLIGRMLLIDALQMTFRTLRLPKNRECKACGEHPTITQLIDYEDFCMNNNLEITVKDLSQRMNDVTLVDVREPHEHEAGHLPDSIHIPMRQVPARLAEIPHDKDVVVYCRSGARSANAAEFLRHNGFTTVLNLRGGMQAWAREIDPSMRVA
jgi:molybdopterin/thiamine biosynthesis adenylyltransferase/rhodanese-related sulfurtransferase